MDHDDKNGGFDPVRSDEDIDEDAPERGSRVWLLFSDCHHRVSDCFRTSVFLSLSAQARGLRNHGLESQSYAQKCTHFGWEPLSESNHC
jgi:hypothetical protein